MKTRTSGVSTVRSGAAHIYAAGRIILRQESFHNNIGVRLILNNYIIIML